jgi:RHS repeat-associated protein
VIAEYDATNVLRASYLTTLGYGDLPGSPLELKAGGSTSYPLLDGVGSVTAFTDSSGAVSSAFAYTAYGVPVGSSSGTYAYGTYGYDSATGLYYARARYYDPASGRFLGEDPVTHPNLYQYAISTPLNRGDPSGRGIASLEYAVAMGAAATFVNAVASMEQVKIESKGIGPSEVQEWAGYFATNEIISVLGLIGLTGGWPLFVFCAIGAVSAALTYATIKGQISWDRLDSEATWGQIAIVLMGVVPALAGLPAPFTYFQPMVVQYFQDQR